MWVYIVFRSKRRAFTKTISNRAGRDAQVARGTDLGSGDVNPNMMFDTRCYQKRHTLSPYVCIMVCQAAYCQHRALVFSSESYPSQWEAVVCKICSASILYGPLVFCMGPKSGFVSAGITLESRVFFSSFLAAWGQNEAAFWPHTKY